MVVIGAATSVAAMQVKISLCIDLSPKNYD